MMLFKKDRIIRILNLGLFFLFFLLIFRDPFSQRTLIPNLEPYPDTFNYINPALNFAKGEGFNMNREGRIIKPNVPPLYSFSLIPSFTFNPDPRMAYYANVTMAIVSLLFFWLIIRKIFANRVIRYVLLIFYVTNYFIYWVPSLIMAENLTLTLFLITFYLLLLKTTILNSIIIALLAVGLYATKFANIPITAAIISLFIIKIAIADLLLKQKIRQVSVFLVGILFFYFLFASFEQVTKGNNVLFQIYEHLLSIYSSVPKSDAESQSAAASSWFGIQYVKQNLPAYTKSLFGQPNRFLWDNTPIIPSLIGIGALFGLLSSLFSKRRRFISLALLFSITTSVIFMSTFYSFDARYIYIAIPTLIIGFGLFLTYIVNKFEDKRAIVNFLFFTLICIYLVSSFTRIKSQISLNLKYAETPWNYITILKTNEYFTQDKAANGKKPILISALPPFLVDYYTNGNYSLLPLSYDQEFRSMKELVWGPNDYSDLPKLYKKYLNEGYEVYVSRAGLGNEGYTNRDFNTIVKEFETKLVQPGCFDQCNIYSVKLKK